MYFKNNLITLTSYLIFFLSFFWMSWILITVQQDFSNCREQRLLSSCCVWASHCGGVSCCGAWCLEHGLSSCDTGLSCPLHIGPSRTRNGTCVPWIGRWILKHLTTREIPSFNFMKHQWFELCPMVVVLELIDIPEVSSISLNEGKATDLLIKNPSFSQHSSSFVFHLFLPRSRESGWYKTRSVWATGKIAFFMRDSSGSFKELSFYGYSFPQGLIPLYMHILYFPIFSQIIFFPCADYCIKIFFRRYFVTGIVNILSLLCPQYTHTSNLGILKNVFSLFNYKKACFPKLIDQAEIHFNGLNCMIMRL